MKLFGHKNLKRRVSKKGIFGLLFLLIFSGCNKEEAPDCFQTAGEIISKEVPVEAFEELIVYGRIKLYIEQGEEHKVIIESGENLINEISAEVENGRLSLKNDNKCNFFRDYELTSVYVTVPNLTWLQNAGNKSVESIGTLHFPKIWLRAFDQEMDPEIYTNGNFKLDLVSEEIKLTGDNFTHFYLSGTTNYLDVYIANGDGRVEAAGLFAETVEIQHRGTNKIIVNPQKILKGEIRSTGDVISVNRPPVVEIETFYTGKLIFE